MNTILICILVYFAIPIIGIKITGRMITWQGWLIFIFLWPVALLFMGEELP